MNNRGSDIFTNLIGNAFVTLFLVGLNVLVFLFGIIIGEEVI